MNESKHGKPSTHCTGNPWMRLPNSWTSQAGWCRQLDKVEAFRCRQVFSPFSLKLRNTRVAVGQPGGSRGHSPTRSSRGKTGEETRLLVPFIKVSMDSKEFQILVDVINNVGLAEVSLPHCLLS